MKLGAIRQGCVPRGFFGPCWGLPPSPGLSGLFLPPLPAEVVFTDGFLLHVLPSWDTPSVLLPQLFFLAVGTSDPPVLEISFCWTPTFHISWQGAAGQPKNPAGRWFPTQLGACEELHRHPSLGKEPLQSPLYPGELVLPRFWLHQLLIPSRLQSQLLLGRLWRQLGKNKFPGEVTGGGRDLSGL